MTAPRDAYEVLQVRPDAELVVVQAAYRALARRYHAEGTAPDLGRMVEINRAWESIRTEECRARYDQARRKVPVAIVPEPTNVVPREPFDPWRQPAGSAPRTEVIDFGRYAGWRITDLARHDPDYVRWLSRHSSGVRFVEAIARCLPGESGVGRRTGLVG